MKHLSKTLVLLILVIISGGFMQNQATLTDYPTINPKVIIFDVDGTLADSLPKLFEAFNSVSEKYNYPPLTEGHINLIRTKGEKEAFSSFKLNIFQQSLLAYRTVSEYKKSAATTNMISGMREIVQILKAQGYILGIVTSNSKKNVNLFLQNSGLGKDTFDFCYCVNGFWATVSRVIWGKSSTLKNIIKKYKFNKDDVVYVGDQIEDIEAAKSNGIKVISVTWGLSAKELLETGNPEYLISNPEELLSILGIIKPLNIIPSLDQVQPANI